MKTKTLRQVRYYPGQIEYSRQVGYKGRLVTIDVARAITKRLRRLGVQAFHVAFKLSIAG